MLMGDRWSYFQLLQFPQDRFELGNKRGEFLARFDGSVAGQITRLEKLLQLGQCCFRHSPWPQTLLDHSFSDRGSRQVQALTQLFLQQAEKGGEEFVGFILGSEPPQLIRTI